MGKVTVSFESDNLSRTIEHIITNSIGDIDDIDRTCLDDYLKNEVQNLLESDMSLWGKKGYKYFEHLCHYPIQGVLCTYIIGDQPKVAAKSFSVDIYNKNFSGNIVACLYTYLV